MDSQASHTSADASVVAHTSNSIPVEQVVSRTMRLWPAVLIVILQWLAIKVPGIVAPITFIQFILMFWGPIVAAVLILGWWLFASRLRWRERLLMPVACVAIAVIASRFYHETFNIFGVCLYGLPAITTASVAWLLVTRSWRMATRDAGLIAVFVLVWGYFALVRLEGVTGNFEATFAYRWQPSAEEKLLAELGDTANRERGVVSQPGSLALQSSDWPGFRGANRDGRRSGVRIRTDWKEHPPRLVWRHRVGPGWSSFAVVGDHLYTQEQRGEDEVVVAYDANTGVERWVHRDTARFSEIVAGPGPRATPTFHEGKIYALGGAGRLNCLDAVSGAVVWSRDITEDSGAKAPIWGFASSPLIVDGIVTVFAGAKDRSVLGYRAADGELVWSNGPGTHSYCSMQRSRIAGVEQLLVTTDEGLASFEPASGNLLWQYSSPLDGMARVVQPAVLSDNDVLLGSGFAHPSRRLRITNEGRPWSIAQVWESKAISPYYNDLVIHKDHLYGFTGLFFTCVRLDDGKSQWKERGYGNGQVLLLSDQDLLLVVSEKGEVALVEAKPDSYRELARFQAIDGKTWNHPVIAHGKLFVRNGEEAACYQLELETKE